MTIKAAVEAPAESRRANGASARRRGLTTARGVAASETLALESSVDSLRAMALERKLATSSAFRLSRKRDDHGEAGPEAGILAPRSGSIERKEKSACFSAALSGPTFHCG